MLTEQEMQEIAENYISFLMNKHNIELVLYDPIIPPKSYGNLYYYNSKSYFETRDINDSYVTAPFLVEKRTGRVVSFGTVYTEEYYLEAYENGTLELSLTRYWYPDTQKYSHK